MKKFSNIKADFSAPKTIVFKGNKIILTGSVYKIQQRTCLQYLQQNIYCIHDIFGQMGNLHYEWVQSSCNYPIFSFGGGFLSGCFWVFNICFLMFKAKQSEQQDLGKFRFYFFFSFWSNNSCLKQVKVVFLF